MGYYYLPSYSTLVAPHMPRLWLIIGLTSLEGKPFNTPQVRKEQAEVFVIGPGEHAAGDAKVSQVWQRTSQGPQISTIRRVEVERP
jgi:hypothetical protein